MDQHQALLEFRRIATLVDADIDAANAALLIAAAEYPELDVKSYLDSLAAMASVAASRVGDGPDPLYRVNTLSEYLFDELGFQGNREEYYDPRNSFFNDVLERRLGIPITLSLLYVEVGKRMGIPLIGVGMPGHFLVRHRDIDDWLVDPFNGGLLLSVDECAQRLQEVTRSLVQWDPRYLAPVSSRDLLARILRNLKGAYSQQGDLDRTIRVLDWALALEPQATKELRDRGLAHFRLGHYAEALDDLRGYLDSDASGPDGPQIQDLVGRISRQLRT